ncbi:unnamed protein product [Closterium sp. NIES-65]|nr:unnamed protein product [Closterium sp. NIES-65]
MRMCSQFVPPSSMLALRLRDLSGNNFTGSIPDSISTLTTLEAIYMANNKLSGSLPAAISRLEKLEQIWLDNNNIEGPLPTSLCSLPALWRIDVSNNSLYGRINRNFKNMVADGTALINLGHNFFFGDAVLFAAGCQVCPMEITEPNNLDMGDTFDVFAGKCNNLAATGFRDYSVAGAGKEARVSLSGNCLTLSADAECSSNATQRSTAACQAFCSITDNGPCDGHGECVPPAPASTSNFTCLCDAGYSTIDLGNGSTCAIVNSTTTTVSSLSTGAIVGIAVGCFAGFTLLAALVAWLLWPRGQKKWEGLDVCEQFSIHQMAKATNNWSDDNVLGKGGFGIVYKGHSPQGQLWAIKRSTVMTNDFETEVRAMASLHHSHLVRLLGFCLDQNVETGKQEQILVYEFVGNRDLEYHIHSTKTKVADFGLLKLLTHGDADTTRVAGTPGYVDPDYNRTHIITAKSDVFSFGIVLLELLSGKSPRVMKHSHIRDWARKRVEAFELSELKDPKMHAVSEEAIVGFTDLALDCMKCPGTLRPSMTDVAYRLTALIEKHCPDKEEWEIIEKEESASNGVMSSRNDSDLSWNGGRDSQMSSDSHPSAISSISIGSMADGVRSWLHLKPTRGY